MRTSSRAPVTLAGLAVAALALGGCGSAVTVASPPAAVVRSAQLDAGAPAPLPRASAGDCTPTVDGTLLSVAQRIYAQAADGRNVTSVTRRLARSTALSGAVARGDSAATQAALRPLLKDQVRRLVVTRGTRVLARIGSSAALAPVTGTIRSLSGAAVGQYRLAVASDASIAGTISAVTGAGVTVEEAGHAVVRTAGPSRPASTPAFAATAFPSGTLTIRLSLPATPSSLCTTIPGQTAAVTIGAVAERLFRAEQGSPATARVLQYVAHDRRLLQAVADDDPAALRAEIVHLFRDPALHVVRIRAVTASGRLVNDVGGSYVLAPASATLHLHGRAIGQITLSIQDDTGYIKLMDRFTGALVSLSTPAGPVPGSNSPVPGRAYWRFDFLARAFPDGPLDVSLLI